MSKSRLAYLSYEFSVWGSIRILEDLEVKSKEGYMIITTTLTASLRSSGANNQHPPRPLLAIAGLAVFRYLTLVPRFP